MMMTAARIFYRTRQFWSALWVRPVPADFTLTSRALTPALMALFLKMQPSEQSHSLGVLQKLVEQGENHPDLWVAALLHDVGKSRYPLHVWERVVIVLGKALFPARVKDWGSDSPGAEEARTGPQAWRRQGWRRQSWRRPFIVAEKHPVWGAELASQAGASSLATALIRRHQEELEPATLVANQRLNQIDPAAGTENAPSLEDRLLYKLQAADSES